MKKCLGWYFPDHEEHLIGWLGDPKNQVVMNGRFAYQGKKQAAAIEACRQHKKGLRTAIDVGAHVGLWSYNLAQEFDLVVAYEPLDEHRACFVENVQATNVMLFARALGEVNGFVNITTEDHSSGNSWVALKTGHARLSPAIPMERLDDHNHKDVDFIKVDCEGYELHVLRGAEGLLNEWRPVVCVEQKPRMALKFGLPELGAVDYLKSLGYRLEKAISGDYIMYHPEG